MTRRLSSLENALLHKPPPPPPPPPQRGRVQRSLARGLSAARERERENKRRRERLLFLSLVFRVEKRNLVIFANCFWSTGREYGNIPKNRYTVLLLGEMERRTKMAPITSVRRARSKMSRRSKERLRCVYVLLIARNSLSLSSNGLFFSSSSSSSSSKCPPRSRYVYVAKYSRTFDSIER